MNDWMKFGLAAGVLCLFCPPLLAIIAGVAIFCGFWYLTFKLMGG